MKISTLLSFKESEFERIQMIRTEVNIGRPGNEYLRGLTVMVEATAFVGLAHLSSPASVVDRERDYFVRNCKANSGIKDYLNSRHYVSQLMIDLVNYLPIIFRPKFLQYSTFVRLKILPHNTL